MQANRQNSATVFTPEDFGQEERLAKAKAIIKRAPEDRPLSDKQEQLVIQCVLNPEKKFTDNMVAAGFSPKANPRTVKRALRGKLGKTFASQGFYEIDIVRPIIEGMQATRRVPYRQVERDQQTGRIISEKTLFAEFPDHRARALFIKLAAQLTGYFEPIKIEHSGKVEHQHSHNIMRLHDQVPPELLEEEYRKLKESGVEVEFEILPDEDDL